MDALLDVLYEVAGDLLSNPKKQVEYVAYVKKGEGNFFSQKWRVCILSSFFLSFLFSMI